MDEQGLQNLLALGFTYEDLYKRGLLVLKSAEQNQQNQQNQQQNQQNQQQDAAAALTAVLESFKDDLIKAIQKTNLRDATRGKNENLSLDDAIAGLMKGDSTNG